MMKEAQAKAAERQPEDPNASFAEMNETALQEIVNNTEKVYEERHRNAMKYRKDCNDDHTYWKDWSGYVGCMTRHLIEDGICGEAWTGQAICIFENVFNFMVSRFFFCEAVFWICIFLLILFNVLTQLHDLAVLDSDTHGTPTWFRTYLKTYHSKENAPVTPLRALISAVIVLNMFQADWLDRKEWNFTTVHWFLRKNPVWSCVLFIVCEQLLSNWALVFTIRHLANTHPKDNNDKTKDKVLSKPVSNRYQHLTWRGCRLYVLFLVQFSLLCFYVLNLHESGEKYTRNGSVSCFKWLIGVGVVIVAGDGEMGQRFNAALWFRLHHEVLKKYKLERDRLHCRCGKGYDLLWDIRRRASLSWMINSAGLTFLRRTFPVILSNADPWSFIMDCMAIFFIVKLDDISSDDTIDEDLQLSGVDSEAVGERSVVNVGGRRTLWSELMTRFAEEKIDEDEDRSLSEGEVVRQAWEATPDGAETAPLKSSATS
jgi:hypothetical protein